MVVILSCIYLGVDIVLGGHEHIYERYWPIYDFQVHVYYMPASFPGYYNIYPPRFTAFVHNFCSNSEVDYSVVLFFVGESKSHAGQSAPSGLYTYGHLQA